MWRTKFLAVAFLLLGLMIIGAAVSIGASWPAQFGGRGNPDDVASEFLSRGTALAPPLGPLVLYAAAVALALRRDRWGVIGAVGVMALSVVFIIGSLGEAFAQPTPDVPRGALILSGIVGSSASLLTLATAVAMLRERRQRTRHRAAQT